MPKPVPPRFPPARVLTSDQNAFIQSLEPRPLHAVPVTEPTDRPIDVPTHRLIDPSTESLVDPATKVPSDSSTSHPVDASPERSIDGSPSLSGDQSLERPIDPVTRPPVSPETDPPVSQSPHRPVTQSTQRPRSKANKRQGRAVFERANGEPVRKLSFYIPADVAKSLQLHCVANERDMSTFVTDLVRRALAKASG